MTTPAETFNQGYQAYRRGDYVRARQLLSSSTHPQAAHVLGLVERRCGNYLQASSWLAKAADLEPHNHEIRHNQALLALDLGNPSDAEQYCRRALELAPNFFVARNTLARTLRAQKRWSEARSVYAQQLATDPSNVIARYGMATVLLETGDADGACALLNPLIETDPDNAAMLFMRGRALQELENIPAALTDYTASHALEPTPHSLRVLANLLWMTADRKTFDDLLDAAGNIAELRVTRAELLRERGTPDAAIAAIGATATTGASANELAVQALAEIDREDAAAAAASARRALTSEPGHALATSALITSLLMTGDAEQALQLIRPMRVREPCGQHWIAYEATALRLADPEAYAALADPERWVRSYSLPVPAGYESLHHFNAAFLAELQTHHLYKTHPLNQSLREGSQTSCDLRSIKAQVVQDYFAALDTPIRRYLDDVGHADDHPLTRRNFDTYEFAGSWSVLLRGRGRHVNHVHPEGWISSAYYVSVPDECHDTTTKPGWIKFGEPPFATTPASPPHKWIRPEAGLVVLFPSFMWHGTTPIGAHSLRVTAPFDLVPGGDDSKK